MPYKFQPTKCPHCGGAPGGLAYRVYARADLIETEDGVLIPEDYYDIHRDDADVSLGPNGKPLLCCSECFEHFEGEETEDSDPCV